ncbi:MAG: protein kinase [Chloroflexota bacterium]
MSRTTKILNNQFQVDFDNPNSFIGQGGMGAVYLGRETTTNTPVAIKVLKGDFVEHDPEMIKRFEREGDTLRQLNHPNIVKMLGAENRADAHCLVMEYVSGGSLRDLLDQQKKLSLQRSLYIALDLADALTRAHRLEILHRDIKPGNVLIAEDGTPRLTDFGMARVSGTPNITQDGAIIGTMAYLSPEAFQGDDVDERADIWAYGVMLWEMLVGERPFPQEQPAPLIQAIVSQPLPDLEKLSPELPTALVDLIYRMLDKNPASRIPSARLIGAELEAIIRGDTSTLQPVVSVEDSTGRFDLDTTQQFPAIDTENTHVAPNNLQNQPTPFVGREDEIADILQMVIDDANLITLTGPGGIGKSRLSIEVAKRALGHFEDGVYAVPLHALDDAHNVVSEIAEQINFSFGGGDPHTELSNYLRGKHMLLVLDNFETVMDAADFVSTLIASAPRLTIIVTSRERLRLRGEQVYDVDAMKLPTKRDEQVDTLSQFPVVKLFAQSAERAQPSFELSDETAHDVADIVRLVGGLPLGVELAAG